MTRTTELPQRPTRQQVADFYHVSLNTVDRQITLHNIRRIKIGRLTRLDRDEVIEAFEGGDDQPRKPDYDRFLERCQQALKASEISGHELVVLEGVVNRLRAGMAA